jgi:hypothetical protein
MKAARLAALIKKRLGIEPAITPGSTGEFTVIADGEMLAERGGNWFTRGFGVGFPNFDSLVEKLQKRLA